ncbi:hypothetical protein ABPG74_005588 [Tetrahymena malaccensis]
MYQYFEAEEQAKQFQQILIQRVLKQVAFKKWAKKVKEFGSPAAPGQQIRPQITFKDQQIQSQEGQQNPDVYQISDFGNEMEDQIEEKSMGYRDKNKPILNLRFGDVCYLKYYTENGKKGIVSGDGIASNKVECLPQKFNQESTKQKSKSDNEDLDSEKSFGQKKDYLDSMAKMMQQQEKQDTSIFRKSAQQQFRKCLFRVVNEKKYFYQEKFNRSKQINQEDILHLSPKVDEEKKENQQNFDRLKGSNICYGQVIQLVHLYSDCTLTINPNILAQQNCCREMSLEENDNQWSNFILVSQKNTKKFGEPVLYGDQILLQSVMDKSYWLNIDNVGDEDLVSPLEVNASEFNIPLKLCNYLDFKTVEEREGSQFKGKILQAGEVIRLFNRSLNGYIGVRRSKNFVRILKKRAISFVQDNTEIKMEQDYFDKKKSIETLEKNFALYIQQKEEQTEQKVETQIIKGSSKKQGTELEDIEIDDISAEKQVNVDIQTLWEIQKEESFSSQIPSHKGFFYLKNLASSLYLAVSKNTSYVHNQKYTFSLTFDTSSNNLFKLGSAKSSKKSTKDEYIQYNNSILIQGISDPKLKSKSQISQDNFKTLVLQEKKDGERQHIIIECVDKLEKQSKEKYIYEILSVNKDLRQTTDRVSSLFPFLLDFYIFLQDWGHQVLQDSKDVKYTYKQAFDSQKQLNNKVIDLCQSIDNLSQFLSVEGQLLMMRQDVIRESGLLTLLILILQQIDFKIFGKLYRDKSQQEKNQIISERSAQKIAQQKLKKCISIIYKILISCIKSNSKSCSFLISSKQYLSFFLLQLNKYSSDVKHLIREAIKWMEESDEKEKQNIKDWCDKINNISSSKLGIQIFVMEVLSLSMVNPMEEAIEENQKFCKKLLFKPKKESQSLNNTQVNLSRAKIVQNSNQYFNVKLEQKKLISFLLVEDSGNQVPCVIFNMIGKNATKIDFEKDNQKLKWIPQYKNMTAENQSNAFPFPFFQQSEYENGIQNKAQRLKKYDQYAISVLHFYAQMCKGRNIKVIRVIKSPEVGLTDEFIITCLKLFNPFENIQKDERSRNLKNLEYFRCFLALYQETILDADPLLRISESKVNSMIRQDIQNFQISDKSYKLFHDFVLTEDRHQYLNARLKVKTQTRILDKENEDEQEYQEIRKFADEIVLTEERENKITYQIMNFMFKGYTSKELSNSLSIFKEHEADIQLKTLLQMLKIVHSRIDLGYNDLYTNSHIIKNIQQIFYAYICYKQPTFKYEKKSWVFDLLVSNFKECKDQFLITRVILEASKIIQVLDSLQRNLIIVSQIQQNMGKKLTIKFQPTNKQLKGAGLELGREGDKEIEMVNLLNQENNQQVVVLTTENLEEDLQMQKEENEYLHKLEKENQKQDERDKKHDKVRNKESYDEKFKKIQVGELEFDLFRQSNMTKIKRNKNNLENLQDLSIGTLLFETLKCAIDNPTLQQALSQQLTNYIQQNKILIDLFDQIEIIDDKYELQLLRDICGDTSDQISAKDMLVFASKITNQLQAMAKNKIDVADQAQQFLPALNSAINTMVNQSAYSMSNLNQSGHKHQTYMQLFQDGLENILNLFRLDNYEECKKNMKLAKSKEDYFTQLQNLLRNTNFHKSMLHMLQYAQIFVQKEKIDIKDDDNGTYKNLYSNIIDFLCLFVKNNSQNRLEVLPYFNKILELALFQYDAIRTHDYSSDKIKNRPLKISKLCIELLQDKKQEIDQIKHYIMIIFEQIEKYNPEVSNNKSDKIEDQTLSIMKKQAICQYLKILIQLTTSDFNVCIKANQQKIMDNILNSQSLKSLSKPFTTQEIEKLSNQRKKNSKKFTQTYYQFKMHELCLTVLAKCCKNNKLLIQEIHRMVSSDSLKNNFVLPATPFMLKRAYLKLLFETYIQRDDSAKSSMDSDVMLSDEIAEVIEQIYKIVDDKNNYTYLEGLVKIDPKNQSDSWELRTHILQEKINQNRAEFSQVIQQAKRLLKDNKINKSAAVNGEYDGILKDPVEYWKFLLNEGVIHFLTDTFDERIQELGQQQKSSSLKEQYSKIKKMFANIIGLINQLETSYRTKKDFITNLQEQKMFMLRVNDIIPKYKSQKGGETFKIGATSTGKVLVQTYNTRKEDLEGGGFQDVEDDNKNDVEFYKYMRLFLIRNRLTIQDFCENLVNFKKNLKAESSKPLLKEAISLIINRDKVYVTDSQIIEFLKGECLIKKVMKKRPYSSSLNEEDEELDTDFDDQNISIIVKQLIKALGKKKGSQDISQLEKDDEEDHNKDDMIPPDKLVTDLDMTGLKENLKMKLLKLAQNNLQMMGEALNCVDMEETPFTNFDAQDRVMEEVFITQILLEMIKKPDIDLFCQYEFGQQQEMDAIYVKNLTENIQNFIEATKKIFQKKTIYLIKFLRKMLEIKQINQDTIEDKTNKDKNIQEQAQKAVKDYKILQTIVGKTKIHEPIIDIIIRSNYQNETIESLVLLMQLLNYGNSDNQTILLNYLKQEKEICLDFFSYLRDFFQNKSTDDLIQIKESRRKIPKQTVYFEVHSYLVMRVLQLFCENVNVRFQNFLRQQNENMGIYSANTNVVLETSNFLSFLLEDPFTSIECKSKMIRQCLETLVDFSTGAGENQTIICQNKRLFSFLQDKILDMKIDFTKPNIYEDQKVVAKQENKINMLISSIKFLITMVQGNRSPENLIHIVNHIECDKLLYLMYKIYKERLKPIQKNLILEIQCPSKANRKHIKCNDSVCYKQYITDFDNYLYEIGFQIFTMLCYLMEVFPEEHALDPFTQLLDSKYDFNIFDFMTEDWRRNSIVSKFHDNLRKQKIKKRRFFGKKKEQLPPSIPANGYQFDQQQSNSLQNKKSSSVEPLVENGSRPQSQQAIDSVQKDPHKQEKVKSIIVRIFTKQDKSDKEKVERLDGTFKFDVNFNRIINQDNINKRAVQDIRKQMYREQTLGDDEDYIGKEKPKSLLKILLECIYDIEMMEQVPRYFFFFKNQVGITEINIDDQIQLIYFQKPFCSNFLTPYIKNHLIYESNRESDEDRLLFLLENFNFYYKQMIYKQYWYQFKIHLIMENWRTIKDIQFVFLLLIVFLQLFFLEGSIGDETGNNSKLDELTQAFAIVQLILTIFVLLFCGIERWKISINRFTNADSWRKIQYLKENAGLTRETLVTKFQKTLFYLQDDLNPSNYKRKSFFYRIFIYTFLICSDFENFYHACYLAITIAGFFLKGPLIYGILLLDIIKRSHQLQQIIKSITQNLYNIFIFTYLGVIVMYIFGIGGFVYFRGDFNQDNKAYNNTFISTVASVINVGLRNGGGISESMNNVVLNSNGDGELEKLVVSDNYFWGRYFYDLFFFILINMLFIQIIFGIILDTFGELRAAQDKIREEVDQKCFVCSMSRGYVDSRSEEGWYSHIYLHHNAYHLVFYLIYITKKDETECNYIEKYVKKCIEQKQINFIPDRQSTEVPEQEPVKQEGE